MISRTRLLWLNLLLVLLAVNYIIVQKELTLHEGATIYLQLAPVDPRSLIQGDYMILQYAIEREMQSRNLTGQGKIVVRVDDDHVAQLSRQWRDGLDLDDNEHVLRYWTSEDGQVYFGAESFLFQEGDAHYYQQAEYAELKVDRNGDVVLVGLRGPDLERLGP